MPGRRRQASAIPVGSQFTPGLIALRPFLKALVTYSGNKTALEEAIWKQPVRKSPAKKPPTKRRRSLPLEAAVQYGLLTSRTYKVTDLTKRLLATTTEEELHTLFARHILLECGGLRVAEAVRQMGLDDRRITGDTLSRYLTEQGFFVGEHNTAINSLRMWLAEAGVFPRSGRARAWEINESRLEEIVGYSEDDIGLLSGLNERILEPRDWIKASDVRDWAEANVGVRFGRASLPKEVLKDLKDIGLIEYRSGGTKGGKTSRLRLTQKFRKEVLELFVDKTIEDMDSVIAGYYRKRPSDIYSELESADTGTKGRALEALAIHVMRLLGLRFIAWRVRAKDKTGQAEVDAVLAGIFGGVPTRWQIQCKNTPGRTIPLEEVAKEVGLLPITQATHILFLANGRFSRDAEKFAEEVMLNNPVTIFLLNDRDFEDIKEQPASLVRILRFKAERILRKTSPGSLFAWQ